MILFTYLNPAKLQSLALLTVNHWLTLKLINVLRDIRKSFHNIEAFFIAGGFAVFLQVLEKLDDETMLKNESSILRQRTH